MLLWRTTSICEGLMNRLGTSNCAPLLESPSIAQRQLMLPLAQRTAHLLRA
jgi:hypothetical protein